MAHADTKELRQLVNRLSRMRYARLRFDAGDIDELAFVDEVARATRELAGMTDKAIAPHFRRAALDLAEGKDWYEAIPTMLLGLESIKREDVSEYVEQTISSMGDRLHKATDAPEWMTAQHMRPHSF